MVTREDLKNRPLKVKIFTVEYKTEEGVTIVNKTYFCRNCGQILDGQNRVKVCEICGRKIGWEKIK